MSLSSFRAPHTPSYAPLAAPTTEGMALKYRSPSTLLCSAWQRLPQRDTLHNPKDFLYSMFVSSMPKVDHAQIVMT